MIEAKKEAFYTKCFFFYNENKGRDENVFK